MDNDHAALSRLPDEDLMRLIGQGIIAPPVAELFRRHNRPLFNFIAWLCQGDIGEAEDICQKTWVKLMQHHGNYQPTAVFRAFLYQIARNTLIDAKRDAYARRREPLHEEAECAAPGEDISPETEILLKRNIGQVRQALLDLPAAQREAIVLRFFSDMTLEEIAGLTGVGFETVKSRMRYGFAHLRRVLEPCDARV
ncbi:MAG: sigma-70 family RNA polymerase sigma factor [Zoogloeaceae bacterium]|jgi:RNA polymerase sigma-70 factor (ECF subfamily)|nr:sigma-70 family RNA polymerase sigma factor [Zoogloeaceae bacterium]